MLSVVRHAVLRTTPRHHFQRRVTHTHAHTDGVLRRINEAAMRSVAYGLCAIQRRAYLEADGALRAQDGGGLRSPRGCGIDGPVLPPALASAQGVLVETMFYQTIGTAAKEKALRSLA